MALSDFPDLTNNESTLLIKFIEFADKKALTRVDAANIHTDTKEFGVRPIMLRATFENLCRKSILVTSRERSEQGLDDYVYYEINPLFADQVDSYFEFMTITVDSKSSSNAIPASDRFVQLDDNQVSQEAKETLAELAEAIRGANDLFLTAEDRIQVSQEIDYIKDLIGRPKIHVAAVWDAAKSNTTLKWLSAQVTSAIVRQVAIKALENLHSLLAHLLRF